MPTCVERLSACGPWGAAGTPHPRICRVEADDRRHRVARPLLQSPTSASSAMWLAVWTWPSASGEAALSSRTEGCPDPGLCGLRARKPFPSAVGSPIHRQGDTLGLPPASSITAPLRAGRPALGAPHPTPTPPHSGRVTRAAAQGPAPGRIAQVLAHRLGPVSLHTRAANGRQSPQGPDPAQERPRRAIGPHDLAPMERRPSPADRAHNGAFSGRQRPGSG